MPDQTPLTPERVRALAEDLRDEVVSLRADRPEWGTHDATMEVLERAAVALEASLPREDEDLAALEPFMVHVIREDMRLTPEGRGGAVRADPATPGRGALGQPGDNLVHDYDAAVAALLARVRTAEAERDEQAKQREHWATENNSLWSWILALGALAKKGGFQDGGLGWQEYISRAVHAAVEDRALLTVETAEEWEYGVKGLRSEPGPIGRDEAQAREAAWNWGQPYYRRRPSSPWEPVPPTPEEAALPLGHAFVRDRRLAEGDACTRGVAGTGRHCFRPEADHAPVDGGSD